VEAVLYQGNHPLRIDYTPSGADVSMGEIVLLATGLVGVCDNPQGIPDGELGSLETNLVYKVAKASATTFDVGAKVAWDDDANLAVADGDANDDGTIGVAVQAGEDGKDYVYVWLNKTPLA
jgi:predicted RecA/RadA family phage recombinase